MYRYFLHYIYTCKPAGSLAYLGASSLGFLRFVGLGSWKQDAVINAVVSLLLKVHKIGTSVHNTQSEKTGI